MLSAVLVQVKGWQRSFQPSMKRRIKAMRSLTLVKLMETLRDMGVEDRLMREAIPLELMGNTTYCTSLAGEELGRIPSWGTDTVHRADYELQSPCAMLDAPQTITEPVLVKAAQERGAKVRFDTEYLSHVQDGEGVSTTVRDRLMGAEYTIRSKYLVGADGARSKVAADLDLPYEGPGAVGGSLSISFEADLSRFVAYCRQSCIGCCSQAPRAGWDSVCYG
jgi:2,4-dichlorophenol 6-monooxygenase